MAFIVACSFLFLCAVFLVLALGVCRLSGEADDTYSALLSRREGSGTAAS